MKKMISMLAILALILSLTACGQAAAVSTEAPIALANGGVLCLKVNPEIAINYDNDGIVTGVTARNDDALKVLAGYAFQGKQTKTVVSELVTLIGDAGYFVEEIDGTRRQITLEIEPGSALPSNVFLDDVVAEIKAVVEQHQWTTPLNVEGITDYGILEYVDTDYGPNADGATDYDDTDYGPNSDGITDYDHGITDYTDYGPNSDGVTDYDGTDYLGNTDYGPNADGLTDYDHNDNDYTDYGEGSDGVTDYGITDYNGNTDYGIHGDGVTDYDVTDYGVTDYGVTDYAPAASSTGSSSSASKGTSGSSVSSSSGSSSSSSSSSAPAPAPKPSYDSHTDYGSHTDYDSHTNYDNHTDYDSHSNYADSGYSDYD